MKKLLALMAVLSFGVVAEVAARKHLVKVDEPCIRCEKEEMIKVCAEPEVIAGYRCPPGFDTLED